MSVQIDPEAYRQIQSLPEHARAAAMEAYQRRSAGGDDPPAELRRQWMREAIAEAEAAAQAASFSEAETGIALADCEGGGISINGVRCRPMTAGVISVLERIGHPLAGADDDPSVDLTFEDLATLLFCLVAEPADLIAWSGNGGRQLRDNAVVWAFDLDVDAIKDAFLQAQAQYVVATAPGESDDEPGDDDDAEKKTHQ